MGVAPDMIVNHCRVLKPTLSRSAAAVESTIRDEPGPGRSLRTSPDNSLDLVPLASREGFGGDEQKVGAEKQDRLRSFTYF